MCLGASRKLEEDAHQSGYQHARAEYEAVLQKRASAVAFLESKLQQAEDTKKELEAHYQRECEALCQRIRELVRFSPNPKP